MAAQDAGITPIVRVPGFEHFHATRVLDGGALGVIVPHVDDAEVGVLHTEDHRRAVLLGPGPHAVRFEYRPLAMTVGTPT